MPRSDLLLSLVQAGSKGDQSSFRRTLEAIVAEERGRQHHAIADKLAEYLKPADLAPVMSARPISATPNDLVDEIEPGRKLTDLVLPEAVRQICADFVEEQSRAELLRSHGLEPRHRVLLIGPPATVRPRLPKPLPVNFSFRCFAFGMTR
jgi:hypothetical protein